MLRRKLNARVGVLLSGGGRLIVARPIAAKYCRFWRLAGLMRVEKLELGSKPRTRVRASLFVSSGFGA